MALLNTNGNYLKVNRIFVDENFSKICYSIYKDITQRTNGIDPNGFDRTLELVLTPDIFIFSQDNSKSTLNNLKTGSYLTLKANGFNDWIDA